MFQFFFQSKIVDVLKNPIFCKIDFLSRHFCNFSHSEKVLSQKEASTFWEVDMWAEAEHVQKSDKIRQTTIIHHPTITIHLGS